MSRNDIRPYMWIPKPLLQEYRQERSRLQRQNRRLAEKGLPTLNVPKARDLKGESDLARNLRKMRKWQEEKRGSVRESRKLEEQKKEVRRERERQKRSERRSWIESKPARVQKMIRHLKKYGVNIKNDEELDKWYKYLSKRKAMAGKHAYYKFDKFVDAYEDLKEQGKFEGDNFELLMADFDIFLSDEEELKKRMENMNLSYDAGFIDQLYDEWIRRQEDTAEEMGKTVTREIEKLRRERDRKRRNKK